MIRLDTLVAKVLADARQRMLEERAGGVDAARKSARVREERKAPALASSDRLSPRATVRRVCGPRIPTEGNGHASESLELE